MTAVTDQEIAALLSSDENFEFVDEGQNISLRKLVDYYNDTLINDEEKAQQVRQIFLRVLEYKPAILVEEKFSCFLAEHIKPEDFATFQWENPEYVATFCETLYSVRFPTKSVAENVNSHIYQLLRHALQQYERKKEYEKMFQLLRLTPVSLAITEMELHRLRGLAYLYEMRRVRRNRRFLFGYLAVQLVVIMLVFPFLFVNAENGRIQRQIEEAVDNVAQVELSEPGEERQFLTYADGLYWSLITAGSIGYGDITPKTKVGKVTAAILGLMGVITVGVIAGLILQWITIRRLD